MARHRRAYRWFLGLLLIANLLMLFAPVSPSIRFCTALVLIALTATLYAEVTGRRGPVWYRTTIVERRDGRRCIAWRGFIVMLLFMSGAVGLGSGLIAAIFQVWTPWKMGALGCAVGAMFAVIVLLYSLSTPVDELAELDASPPNDA